MISRERCSRTAGPHLQLGQQRGYMVVHGPLGYDEPGRDLLVAQFLCQQLEHLVLAGGEPEGMICG